MQQEKIAILQYLQKQGGSLVVRNPIELGLNAKAFVVAVQSLCRHGLVEQDGLALAVLSGTPVTLRLTKVGFRLSENRSNSTSRDGVVAGISGE
jgi:hypothetical protein